MTDTPERPEPLTAPDPTAAPVPDPRTPTTRKVLIALAVLGALAMALSIFLWWQLVVSRQGGTPLCGFGEHGACGALWDSDFAAAVQRATAVPVAGWGWIWGLAALVLPLGALWRNNVEAVPAWITAVRWTAVAGVVSTVALAAVAVGEGVFCAGCVGTYLLVAAYAAFALWGLREHGFADALQGAWIALGAVSAGFLLALWPSLQTPDNSQRLAREALEGLPAPGAPAAAADGRVPAGDPAPSSAYPAGSPDALLQEFLARLDPSTEQLLADTLYLYQESDTGPRPAPRALAGPADAKMILTDFTDALCPACADLHANLKVFFEALPPGSFAVDARHFPLDGTCNPLITAARDGLRCLAAKAQICMEDHPKAFEMSGRMFEQQRSLSEQSVRDLAGGYLGSRELDRCLADPETDAKLQEDIRYAERMGIHGTPLILVNGKEASSFGPLLYVLGLTGGQADHPALQDLPGPSEQALSGDPHAGHGH